MATTGPTGIPHDLLGRLGLLEHLVELVCATDPEDGPGALAAEASRRTVALLDRLSAQRLAWLGRVEAEGAWTAESLRTFAHWLAWSERRGLPVARREARAATVLRDDLPATLRAARAGRVTAPQVDVLARTLPTSQARRDALAEMHAQERPGAGEEAGGGAGAAHDDVRHASAEPDNTAYDSAANDSAAFDSAAHDGAADSTADDAPSDLALPTSLEAPGHARGCTADAGTCTCERRAVSGEQVMLGLAARFDLRDLGAAARRFAHVADPESDERGYRRAQDREHLDLSRTLGGYHVAGFLTEEHGQLVQTAVAAMIGVPSADDGLLPTQRRAIALAGLARRALDGGELGPGAAVRPHLTVLVPWRDLHALAGGCGSAGSCYAPDGQDPAPTTAEDLRAELLSPGPTWLDGSGPVSRQVLERIAADCTVTRVVFGPTSEVLDVGRAQRTFTGGRRKAVVARDRGCVWPGCDAPPQVSEVHHARVHWADGGGTAPDNAALLCWFHHRHVDRRRVAMTWRGAWTFGAPGSYDQERRGPDDDGHG